MSIENLKFGNNLPFWPAIVPAGGVFAAWRLKYPPAASHILLRISDLLAEQNKHFAYLLGAAGSIPSGADHISGRIHS